MQNRTQRESIARRHHEAHSAFYLTLVSIMQGLALGYLLQVIASEVLGTGSLTILSAVQAIACLAVMIIVWHEYAIGVVLFRWRLDMVDSTIPFMFGICEFVMIAAIAIPSSHPTLSGSRFSIFLWSLPVFCLVSCLAYRNQYSKAVIDDDCRDAVAVSKRNFYQAMWTAIGFSAIAIANEIWRFETLGQIIIAGVIAASFIGHCFRINNAYDQACA